MHALSAVGSLKGWFLRYRKRIAEISTGLFLYEVVFNFGYDFLFYPFALTYWGLVKGGIIAVAGSLVSCAVLFWLYDRMKIDWLGAHALRQLDASENKNRLARIMVWVGKEKHGWEKVFAPFVFIFLTLPIDPLIVAIHFQRRHFGGLDWKDWGILFASVASANAWWLIKIGTVVELAKFIWRQFA